MSVIEFNLAPMRGGRREFSDLAEAILWTQQQAEAWESQFRSTLSNNPNTTLSTVSESWRAVTRDLQEARKSGQPIARSYSDEPRLIAEGSPVFTALSWVAGLMPLEAILAAAASADLGGQITWSASTQVNGVLLYERMLDKLLQRSRADKKSHLAEELDSLGVGLDRARETLTTLEEQTGNIIATANQFEANGRARIAELEIAVASTEAATNARLGEIGRNVESLSKLAETTIGDLTNNSKEMLDNWIDAFKEQRKLEAPIKLWDERAKEHEEKMAIRQTWMIRIGVSGLALAGCISFAAYEIAQILFDSATVVNENGKTVSTNGMRASFQFELLFASAATLLYLTMYIWTMKLLVRLYSTEHHLALDARGRAALTETYLSFRQDGTATDADRAIMLGVIFRPVADGIVKEDGPPAISPAALMAILASGHAMS